MKEYEKFLKIVDVRGVDRNIFDDLQTAHMLVSGHRILSQRQVPGLEFSASENPEGVTANIRIQRNAHVVRPIHLCFGVLPSTGLQRIEMELVLEENAAVNIISHCFFPMAKQVTHLMNAQVRVGEGARLSYAESHHHGPFGGITVAPRVAVKVGRRAWYHSDFSLTKGRVGKLDIDYEVEVDTEAVAEMSARVFGHESDEIRIRERMVLAGEAARGLIKTRVAVEDQAKAEIVGITEGNAAQARGHMDCMEIIKDSAIASAQPVVKVSHPQAKVTHEAAIGSVDHQQMETLMAHGLTPEQAVDLIVAGLLGER